MRAPWQTHLRSAKKPAAPCPAKAPSHKPAPRVALQVALLLGTSLVAACQKKSHRATQDPAEVEQAAAHPELVHADPNQALGKAEATSQEPAPNSPTDTDAGVIFENAGVANAEQSCIRTQLDASQDYCSVELFPQAVALQATDLVVRVLSLEGEVKEQWPGATEPWCAPQTGPDSLTLSQPDASVSFAGTEHSANAQDLSEESMSGQAPSAQDAGSPAVGLDGGTDARWSLGDDSERTLLDVCHAACERLTEEQLELEICVGYDVAPPLAVK